MFIKVFSSQPNELGKKYVEWYHNCGVWSHVPPRSVARKRYCTMCALCSGGGQGCLATNSPHSTEGVKNTEEFPMIGVKPLLGDEDGPSAHIFEAKIWTFQKIWRVVEVATDHSYFRSMNVEMLCLNVHNCFLGSKCLFFVFLLVKACLLITLITWRVQNIS